MATMSSMSSVADVEEDDSDTAEQHLGVLKTRNMALCNVSGRLLVGKP